MPTFHLDRLGGVPVEFDGEIIANESARRNNAPRWQEVRIYRVADAEGKPTRWVVERQGRTTVPGEGERPHVYVCESPAEVRKALETTQDGRTFTTNICQRALAAAVDKDPDLAGVAVERL